MINSDFIFQSDLTTDAYQPSTTFQSLSNFTPGASTTSTSVDPIVYTCTYSVFAVLGFGAGCFVFYSFIQTYRAQRRLAWLDCLLWVFCGFQLLLLLLSLPTVMHRLKYIRWTTWGSAALSFSINVASLCGLLILVLMAFVLTLDPPSNALLRKPRVCAALVILTSFITSVLLALLRRLQEDEDAGVSYAAAKLCLAFLVPFTVQFGLLISGCVRQWKSKGRFLSGSEEGPVFLTVAVLIFLCQLFYSIILVRVAQPNKDGEKKRDFLAMAECVLFSGSSLSLIFVLLLHRPSRESLHGVMRQLRDCCRRPGHPNVQDG
uniref:G-protein coupled receptors family 3 profile domain-containing protein n=1 Tax=Cyprinodon variegatus TaxID=28743 RepID=A0A3Q2C891_CYPVA